MSKAVTENARPRTPEPPHGRFARRPKPTVFYPAVGLILAALLLTTFFPEQFQSFIEDGNTVVVNSIGWYYVLLVTTFVFFSLWMAFAQR